MLKAIHGSNDKPLDDGVFRSKFDSQEIAFIYELDIQHLPVHGHFVQFKNFKPWEEFETRWTRYRRIDTPPNQLGNKSSDAMSLLELPGV